jgi:hypothetical protein
VKIHKFVVAFVQLETAIRLFLDDKNYLCAITLAGAAEEIFGTYAKRLNEETAYNWLCNGLQEGLKYSLAKKEIGQKFINYHRNELKHFDEGQPEEFEIDPEFEAISLIIRATINMTAYKIMTENIRDFNKWIRENRPDLVG